MFLMSMHRTGFGFLPRHTPCGLLTNASQLNMELNRLAFSLPRLLMNRLLRNELHHLNDRYAGSQITFDKHDRIQVETATRILLTLIQAYIWENPAAPASQIPPVLAKNSYALAKLQQRFPVLTYYDYILSNWRLIDPAQGMQPENIEPLISFTESRDEAWFIIIHIMIEHVCSKALESAHEIGAMAGENSNDSTLTETADVSNACRHFDVIANSLEDAIALLNRMPDHCGPVYYWDTLRHYLNGWEKITNSDTGCKGVLFTDVSVRGKSVTCTYKGPSGAQSSIIPALDAFLGITHDIDDIYQTLLNFQQYMPHQHVLMINAYRNCEISHWIEHCKSETLTSAYHRAIRQLAKFRLTHLHLVQKYIFTPSGSRGHTQESIVGTGGTQINDYLSNRYHDTRLEPDLIEC